MGAWSFQPRFSFSRCPCRRGRRDLRDFLEASCLDRSKPWLRQSRPFLQAGRIRRLLGRRTGMQTECGHCFAYVVRSWAIRRVFVIDETGFVKKGKHYVGSRHLLEGRAVSRTASLAVHYHASRFGQALIDRGFICRGMGRTG